MLDGPGSSYFDLRTAWPRPADRVGVGGHARRRLDVAPQHCLAALERAWPASDGRWSPSRMACTRSSPPPARIGRPRIGLARVAMAVRSSVSGRASRRRVAGPHLLCLTPDALPVTLQREPGSAAPHRARPARARPWAVASAGGVVAAIRAW